MSNIQSEAEAPYIAYDKKSSIDSVPPPLHYDQSVARPPIDYSSFSALCHSTWRRFLSLWTRRFVLSLLAGQVVSLCITCTNVTTEELTTGNWQLPTTQTFFLYQPFFFFSYISAHRCSPDTFPFSSSIHRTRSISVCFASFDKDGFLRFVYRWF
jgi:Solute carrier family 35